MTVRNDKQGHWGEAGLDHGAGRPAVQVVRVIYQEDQIYPVRYHGIDMTPYPAAGI